MTHPYTKLADALAPYGKPEQTAKLMCAKPPASSALLRLWVWLVRPWWRDQVALLDRVFDYGDPAP